MPRLRPLKTAEAIAAVPDTEPVMIELSDDPVLGAEGEDDGGEKKTTEAEPVKEIKEPVEPELEEAEEVEDEKVTLKKELERLTKAEEDSRKRLATAETERAEAIRQAQERTVEATRYKGDAEQAQLDAILNALEANKSEADSAQKDYETALANGDYKATSDAQRRLGRAEAQIVRLEEGKEVFEARKAEAIKNPPKAPVLDQFENAIANLPDPAKGWLRTHRDYMTDPRKNAKIQSLHWDIIDEGHESFSPGYFESLETHLKLREPKAPAKEPEVEIEREPRRTPSVSAPVTRDTPSLSTGRPLNNRITLSPSQREAAKISGLSEMDYAKQVLKLNQLKKEGHYSESR